MNKNNTVEFECVSKKNNNVKIAGYVLAKFLRHI